MMSKIRIGGAIAAGIVMVVIAGLYSPAFFASAWSQLNIPGYPGPDSAAVTATPLSDAKASEGYPGPGAEPGKTPPPLSETVGEAMLQDAKMYSATYGTDLEESIRRLMAQSEIGTLNQKLLQNESASFGGLCIEHEPSYRVVVQFVRDSKVDFAQFQISDSLKPVIELALVEVSLQELEIRRESAAKRLASLGVPASSTIDVKSNQVNLYVIDANRVQSLIDAKALALPERVVVIQVPALPQDATDIGGGRHLTTCTAGFSVVGYSPNAGTRVKGVTTAGHCPDGQSFAGVVLPWVDGTTGGVRDIAWHRADENFTVVNSFSIGASNRYVQYMRLRAAQSVGDYVCRYGKTTGFGCGTIVTTGFDGLNIQVRDTTVDHGDSGGPWFTGNTILGTTIAFWEVSAGRYDSIYGPVDHIMYQLNVDILFNWVGLPMLSK